MDAKAPRTIPAASVKLCRDCKYARRSFRDIIFFFGWEFAKCAHPTAIRNGKQAEYLVTGEASRPEQGYCETERSEIVDYRNGCGPDGQYWTPRT